MNYIFVILQYIYYFYSDNVIHCIVENIRIKLARVEKGLSQQELADQVEATRQTIGLIEKGKYNPSINLCVRIAKVLGKTLNDLFWEDTK